MMRSRFNTIVILIVTSVLITSCGGGGGGNEVIPPSAPNVAQLVFPQNNAECTEGTNSTNTQSTVTFDWADAGNATNYDILVKNLATNSTTKYSSTISEKAITISRATPYSWYVVSKNTGTKTTQSETWKFYNAGIAVASYSPFPAELVAPAMGTSLASTTTSVSLEWNGSDVDNDIAEYAVLFGETNPPTSSIGTTTGTSLTTTVSSGKIYYWRIITYDSQGNSSTSDVFEFKLL